MRGSVRVDPYLWRVDAGLTGAKLRETSPGEGRLRNMLIGDSVTHHGRTYEVVGFTPTSVRSAQIQPSDPETGATIWVDLQRRCAGSGALRLFPRGRRRE